MLTITSLDDILYEIEQSSDLLKIKKLFDQIPASDLRYSKIIDTLLNTKIDFDQKINLLISKDRFMFKNKQNLFKLLRDSETEEIGYGTSIFIKRNINRFTFAEIINLFFECKSDLLAKYCLESKFDKVECKSRNTVKLLQQAVDKIDLSNLDDFSVTPRISAIFNVLLKVDAENNPKLKEIALNYIVNSAGMLYPATRWNTQYSCLKANYVEYLLNKNKHEELFEVFFTPRKELKCDYSQDIQSKLIDYFNRNNIENLAERWKIIDQFVNPNLNSSIHKLKKYKKLIETFSYCFYYKDIYDKMDPWIYFKLVTEFINKDDKLMVAKLVNTFKQEFITFLSSRTSFQTYSDSVKELSGSKLVEYLFTKEIEIK